MNWIPCEYRMDAKPEGVRIKETLNRDGQSKWKIVSMGDNLNRQGNWEHEPLPSSRDDEFIARCRFETFDEAVKIAEENL